jgi:hypothetical protein
VKSLLVVPILLSLILQHPTPNLREAATVIAGNPRTTAVVPLNFDYMPVVINSASLTRGEGHTMLTFSLTNHGKVRFSILGMQLNGFDRARQYVQTYNFPHSFSEAGFIEPGETRVGSSDWEDYPVEGEWFNLDIIVASGPSGTWSADTSEVDTMVKRLFTAESGARPAVAYRHHQLTPPDMREFITRVLETALCQEEMPGHKHFRKGEPIVVLKENLESDHLPSLCGYEFVLRDSQQIRPSRPDAGFHYLRFSEITGNENPRFELRLEAFHTSKKRDDPHYGIILMFSMDDEGRWKGDIINKFLPSSEAEEEPPSRSPER